ncbi:hypothetical protein GE107_19965 [Cohnella sp. CFH 77786]|uniref:hypothetical protein n=1 Tax=Cohnella sp. CFH 77786 TaxID=2662265 RepID=UPI001C60C89A|nr:hypothetical protein [Cohnella sp. CFH 77786]MBW5448323.1 hypothetical protein [Cohnella sp. CFH 77786]
MKDEVFGEAVREAGRRAYYSLQTPHIHDAYRSLSARGVATGDCGELDGVCRFHVRTPEGMIIRISEKERVYVG